MAVKRQYTITCDQCGWSTTQEGEHYNHDWFDLYRDWIPRTGEDRSEEFHLCSDECTAAFDPREHRSHI